MKSSGNGLLGKDNPMKPAVPGRTSVKTVEGRVGYTENETRFGRSSKSTKIDLPKAKS